MAEQILFRVIRHGITAEVVEALPDCTPSHFVRVTDADGASFSFTPDQGDMIGSLASLARIRGEKLKLIVRNGEALNARS